MDVTKQIARLIADFRQAGANPSYVFVARDIYPFGHPESIDGVRVGVDQFVACGTVYICDLKHFNPDNMTWSFNGY